MQILFYIKRKCDKLVTGNMFKNKFSDHKKQNVLMTILLKEVEKKEEKKKYSINPIKAIYKFEFVPF
jgi:hypothetical protein